MCYNYEVSITTFIIGTLATLYNISVFGANPVYLSISIFWMGAIIMQLWEALLWKDYNCVLFSKLAKYTNLLQPLLGLWLLLIPNYISKNKINVSIVYVVIIIYFLTVLPLFLKNYNCIKNKDGIALKWWTYTTAVAYVVTILILMKILLPDKLFEYQAIFFIGGLIFANLITKKKSPGRVGSIWCWIAAAAPFYNYYLFMNNF
tara:strand:+ start:115 stop:726 length:612 start_codon:yes stop_codon:yes gene_type:complete